MLGSCSFGTADDVRGCKYLQGGRGAGKPSLFSSTVPDIELEQGVWYHTSQFESPGNANAVGKTQLRRTFSLVLRPHRSLVCKLPHNRTVSRNGQELIFSGFDNGLWLGSRRSGGLYPHPFRFRKPHCRSGLRQVMPLKNVTHCAVLHSLGVVLVLGDKVSITILP